MYSSNSTHVINHTHTQVSQTRKLIIWFVLNLDAYITYPHTQRGGGIDQSTTSFLFPSTESQILSFEVPSFSAELFGSTTAESSTCVCVCVYILHVLAHRSICVLDGHESGLSRLLSACYVCVCEGERERKREGGRERLCVYVCVCVRQRERKRESESESEQAREREGGGERECVCVRERESMCNACTCI